MNKVSKSVYNPLLLLLAVYAFIPIIVTSSRELVAIGIISAFFLFVIIKWALQKKPLYKPFVKSNTVFYIFLFWQFLVIIRGLLSNFQTTEEFLSNLFLDQYSLFAFIIPIFLFMGVRKFDFLFLGKLIFILNIVFLLLVIMNYNELFQIQYDYGEEGEYGYGAIASLSSKIVSFYTITGIALLMPQFYSSKIWRLNFFCWIIALIIIILGARRSTIFNLSLLGLAGFYFYTIKSKRRKLIRIVIALSIIGIILVYILSNIDSTFYIFNQRMQEPSSRAAVEEAFIKDMFSGNDWIWGRGLNGSYYCPLRIYDDSVNYYRSHMETGYLNIILQGGIISLFLYLYILLSSFWKGFFKSNNNFTKVFAVYILISILNLIPFGIPAFSLTFLMVWIGVAICESPYYRIMTDLQIKKYFFTR